MDTERPVVGGIEVGSVLHGVGLVWSQFGAWIVDDARRVREPCPERERRIPIYRDRAERGLPLFSPPVKES